jgi:hypothetical protein
MTIEIIQVVWDLFNSFTGSTYISAFIIFVLSSVMWLFIFQGDFELSLLGNLLLIFILADELPWLKIICVIILGLWAAYRLIDIFGQRGG